MRAVIVGAASLTLLATSPALAHHRHYAHHHHRLHPAVESLGHGLGHMLEQAMGNIEGMNHDFVEKLRTAFGAIDSGHCRVGSGFRSHAEQAALHRAKPGLAAAPGHSNHERGLAADLSCTGGGLRWMHAHAGALGLVFPMAYEPWHCEPIGATRYAHRRHSYRYAHHWRHHYARAG